MKACEFREGNQLFFSDIHVAPKFFKVFNAIPKSRSPFLKSNKTFCYPVSVLNRLSKIKLAKRSLISAVQIEEW